MRREIRGDDDMVSKCSGSDRLAGGAGGGRKRKYWRTSLIIQQTSTTPPAMAFQATKKAFTLSPSVRAFPSGVPVAPLLNLAAKAPAGHDDHGHGPAGPRADKAPRWTGGVSRNPALGVTSKTFVGCTRLLACLVCSPMLTFSRPSSTCLFPAPFPAHFRCSQRCTRSPRLLSLPC